MTTSNPERAVLSSMQVMIAQLDRADSLDEIQVKTLITIAKALAAKLDEKLTTLEQR